MMSRKGYFYNCFQLESFQFCLLQCLICYTLLILCKICSAQQQKKEFVAHINKINKNQGLTREEEEANIPEPRDMVVKARNLALGPWYKCSKGRHLRPNVIMYLLEACFNNNVLVSFFS